MKVRDWCVNTALYTADRASLSQAALSAGHDEEIVHRESCEVSAVEPGTAASKAWIVTQGEVRTQKKKLPKISRVVFSVARKHPEVQRA